MYDIPFLIWILREFHPKFIAKKELGKGIPSISFALRNMGSVLIDRSDHTQAISAIREFGIACQQRGFSAVIFPEGTRARDGKMKPFKVAGLRTLLEAMPAAEIVPVSIDGSWELVQYNLLPVPYGVTVHLTVLAPITRSADAKTTVATCEQIIRNSLSQHLTV
jgi:1-acyl-sn-glycerol-3-phosphate acyltransferase